MMENLTAGRLLRANTRACVVGCHIRQSPSDFGSMIFIPNQDGKTFGLVYDIHVDDDGLVRQLASTENVSEEVIQDNRLNRNTPIEMSILFIGYEANQMIFHSLPPHPPLSLDKVVLCSENEIRRFTSFGHFGYFRSILNNPELPAADLTAAHLNLAYQAQPLKDRERWKNAAVEMIITLLRDNPNMLNQVLFAVSDIFSPQSNAQEA